MLISNNWYGAKLALKRLIAFVPFYNSLIRHVSSVLPGRAWVRRIPINRQDVKVNVGAHTIYLVDPDRCEIAKQLFWTNGVREPKEDAIALDVFCALAADADLVLDIGSNTGLFSLVAAKANPAAKIMGFDILPEAVEIFFRNVVRNNCAAVTPLLRGVGVPGTTFTVPSRVGSSSLPSSVSTKYQFSGGIEVPIISLDSLVGEVPPGARVLIKIDVEATEQDIFAHASNFLEKHHPVLLCEVLNEALVDQYESILLEAGYSFYLITDQGLMKNKFIAADRHFKDWLFCVDEPPLEFLSQAI